MSLDGRLLAHVLLQTSHCCDITGVERPMAHDPFLPVTNGSLLASISLAIDAEIIS
jgi:hypothetical protein